MLRPGAHGNALHISQSIHENAWITPWWADHVARKRRPVAIDGKDLGAKAPKVLGQSGIVVVPRRDKKDIFVLRARQAEAQSPS